MKKVISILIAGMMILGLLAIYPVSAEETPEEYYPDYSWYDPEKDEFILTNEAQILGFGYISSLYPGADFAGKTVKLGDNIVLNAGNAADWENDPPVNIMTPVSTFAGTFDGQGYSISGVYTDGSSRKMGLLFNTLSGNACIKDLAILNSYLVTGSVDGGIAGRIVEATEVRFENVYVDVLMYGDAWEAGGFVGNDHGANQRVVFENCVFAGEFKMPKEEAYIGGFIGNASYHTSGTIEFTNCLNLGTICGQKRVGGLVGWGAGITIDKCVNLGRIVGDESGSKLIGGLIGESYAADKGCTNITDSYVATDVMTNALHAESGNTAAGNLSSEATCEYTEITTDSVLGDAAKTVMDKLDWENTWATVENDFPTLKVVLTLLATAAEGPTDESASTGEDPTTGESGSEEDPVTGESGSDENPTTDETTGEESSGTVGEESSATETPAVVTDPVTTTGPSSSAKPKGGCGSSIAIGGVAMICIGAVVLLVKKKED